MYDQHRISNGTDADHTTVFTSSCYVTDMLVPALATIIKHPLLLL